MKILHVNSLIKKIGDGNMAKCPKCGKEVQPKKTLADGQVTPVYLDAAVGHRHQFDTVNSQIFQVVQFANCSGDAFAKLVYYQLI
jgi:hypothetical protein